MLAHGNLTLKIILVFCKNFLNEAKNIELEWQANLLFDLIQKSNLFLLAVNFLSYNSNHKSKLMIASWNQITKLKPKMNGKLE